jgi:hypothetical protein
MFPKIILVKELSAGVAQLGQSVRLIIERPRAQVPPPAHIIETTKPLYTAKINRYLCDLFFKS